MDCSSTASGCPLKPALKCTHVTPWWLQAAAALTHITASWINLSSSQPSFSYAFTALLSFPPTLPIHPPPRDPSWLWLFLFSILQLLLVRMLWCWHKPSIQCKWTYQSHHISLWSGDLQCTMYVCINLCFRSLCTETCTLYTYMGSQPYAVYKVPYIS